MAILTAPISSTIQAKSGIRPAIGATTKAISATMLTLANEFPELAKFALGSLTQASGMAFDAIQQARFEGQLENIDETATLVEWSEDQIKQAKLQVMKAWGIVLPEAKPEAKPALATE